MTFSIPINPTGKGGTALASALPEQPGAAREEAIYQLFASGQVPMLLRFPFPLMLTDGANTITLEVLPDVLGVGNDDDWVRLPMSAPTAQRIADYWNASLITRKLSDAIWAACDEIAPIPEAWYNVDGGRKMLVTSSFIVHNAAIQKALVGKGYTKVSGTKKDVVLTPQLLANPGKVAIYGWHKLDGKPIQGLNAKTHEYTYVDYSHGIRLVAQDCLVNGSPEKFADVLKDPALCKLVSDEGPSTFSRYRTDYPGTPGSTNPPPTLPTGETPPAKPPGSSTAPGGRPPAPPPQLPVANSDSGGATAIMLAAAGALFIATRLLFVDGAGHTCYPSCKASFCWLVPGEVLSLPPSGTREEERALYPPSKNALLPRSLCTRASVPGVYRERGRPGLSCSQSLASLLVLPQFLRLSSAGQGEAPTLLRPATLTGDCRSLARRTIRVSLVMQDCRNLSYRFRYSIPTGQIGVCGRRKTTRFSGSSKRRGTLCMGSEC